MTTSNSGMGGGAFYGGRRATFVQIGSALGVAANCIGWLTFCLMCLGYAKAGALAPLALGLALIGMILTIVGANVQKHAGDVDTHVLASLFINLMGIVGGVLEVGVWLGWAVVVGAGARIAGA